MPSGTVKQVPASSGAKSIFAVVHVPATGFGLHGFCQCVSENQHLPRFVSNCSCVQSTLLVVLHVFVSVNFFLQVALVGRPPDVLSCRKAGLCPELCCCSLTAPSPQ